MRNHLKMRIIYYSRIKVKNIRVFFVLNLNMTDFQFSVKSLQSVPMHHQNNKSQIDPVDLSQSKALFFPLKLHTFKSKFRHKL